MGCLSSGMRLYITYQPRIVADQREIGLALLGTVQWMRGKGGLRLSMEIAAAIGRDGKFVERRCRANRPPF